jgi:acetyl-CoA carboxylase biotin carboxyl carrier protein
MNKKEIEELIRFVSKSGVNEVSLETGEIKITIKNGNANRPVEQIVTTVAAPVMQMAASAPVVAAPVAAAPAAEANYITVKSPMIGTFYRTPNPEKPNFVNIGDEIKPGNVLCIIEAMKLFNEIESEVSGRIVKVLVDNSSPVEYDQPLFLVDPS